MGPKKKSSKYINMGSSFEDLIATSSTVKTVSKSDKRFDLQNILNFHILFLIQMRSALLSFCDYGLKQILIRLGPAHSRAGSTPSPGMHVSTAQYRSLS